MKSARINFGLPNSEYIAEVNDQGEAISFRNQDTDTEYIGGGGGGGDFDTATGDLTITGGLVAELTTDENNRLPVVIENDEMIGKQSGQAMQPGNNTFVLYKGHSYGAFLATSEITTYSGNIILTQTNLDGMWYCDFDITGDFAVTIPSPIV